MWFLQVSDGMDWLDVQQLDEDAATMARSKRPHPSHAPQRVVSRRMLKDGYEDTILKEWPAVTE
jgi:hypothetical protein